MKLVATALTAPMPPSSVPGPITKHLQMLMEVVPPEKDPE